MRRGISTGLPTQATHRHHVWTWDKEGGACLINQSMHAIDLYQWFMGSVDTVYGMWDNYSHQYIEAEDTAVAALRFKSGAMGLYWPH